MDFLQALKAHRGGLIRLKGELYWYNRGWDGVPDRVCLVLDASTYAVAVAAAEATTAADRAAAEAGALLLIDDTPRWIWVSQADMELIT